MTHESSCCKRLEDAIKFCIADSDHTIMDVAIALWPTRKPENAYIRMSEALNPKKRQKLTTEEIIFIMNLCNRYDPLYYIADKCSHQRPIKKIISNEKKDISEKLEEMIDKVMQTHKQVTDMTEQKEESGNITFLKDYIKTAR